MDTSARRPEERAAAAGAGRDVEQLRAQIAQLRRTNEALRAGAAENARAQETLRLTVAHWQKRCDELGWIFRYAPVGLSVLDRDLRYLRINDRLAEMNGKTVEEHLGRTVYDVAPGLAESVREATRPVFERGESVRDIEVHGSLPRAPGIARDRLASYYPVKSESGEVTSLIAVVQDITTRKWAEEALARSEAKYRALYESTSDAVMLVDERGFFDCNSATLRMFRCRARDFLGTHPEDFSPPVQPDGADSRRLAAEKIALAMQHGSHRFEWMHRRADGTVFPADIHLTRMELEGKPLVQGIMRDISEGKRAEEELRHSQQRFAALAAATFEGIAISGDGRIINSNEQFARIFGYEPGELAGTPVSLLVAPEDQSRVMTAIASGAEEVIEAWGVRKDGSRIVVEAHGRSTRYEGRAVRITAIREITAHKQAEEALRQSEGRFRSLVEFLPDGLMVVHEGRIVYANATAARLYGAARPELLRGMRMADRVPPDRRDFVAADMARLAHDSTNRPPHDGAILRASTAAAWKSLNGRVRVVLAAVGSLSQATSPAHSLKTLPAGAGVASMVWSEPGSASHWPRPFFTVTTNLGSLAPYRCGCTQAIWGWSCPPSGSRVNKYSPHQAPAAHQVQPSQTSRSRSMIESMSLSAASPPGTTGTPNSPRNARIRCCRHQPTNSLSRSEPMVGLTMARCVPEESSSRY